MSELSFKEIAIKCVDIYESLPEDEFTNLDMLVTKATGKSSYTYDDLYEILPFFMNEVSRRGIPLVMYKIPFPANEPVTQSFRKIAEKSGFRYPSSSINLAKPKTAEEIVEEQKKKKKN